MNTPRRPAIDRATAEQMLAGRPVAADSGLIELLAAAAAPPRPAELAGEGAAVAAFGLAQRRPAPTPRRAQMMKVLLAKFLTVKLVAAASAASIGGVALAASIGSLPEPVQNAAHTMFGAPSAAGSAETGGPGKPTTEPSTERSTERSTKPAPKPAPRPSPESSHPGSSPSPSLTGLCKAFKAHPMSERGNAINSSAFKALVNAAGGREKVDAFCDALLAADAASKGNGNDKSPTGTPTDKGRPDGGPGNGNGPRDDKSSTPDKPGRPTDKPGRP